MELYIGALIGVCFFIVPVWAYRRGIKDGLAMSQGKAPEPIQNPVQAVVTHVEKRIEAKEAKKQGDLFAEGVDNLMTYDPFAPIKREGEA